jgi:acyl transferase domain-containing protein
LAEFYDADSDNKGRSMAARHGYFLDDIWGFDNSFFNISPREAKSMDPQQRILLHVAQAALDDAGYVEDTTPSFQKNTFGCFIGVATGDYTDNLKNDIDVYYSPGMHNFSCSDLVSLALTAAF